jgi:glycine/D-amino acid oxidase-like deaminating enzyme
MLAPAVGEIMANLIAGVRVDPLLEEFSLQRFTANTFDEGLQI